MRAIRTLTTAALAASLLAVPALSLGQSDDADDTLLPLARQPSGALPLEGTPWRLQWFRWKGVEREPGPEVAARMSLAQGQLQASGGCTTFKGSYGTIGPAIDFKLQKLKENDCAEQTTMVQLAMVDGLDDATRFEIAATAAGGQLTLLDQAGTTLLRFGLDDVGRFTTTLGPAEWSLTAYTVEGTRFEPDPEAASNLIFSPAKSNQARRRASGSVLGSTGCNGFTGEFFLQANVMSFGQLQVTDAPCAASMTPQEAAILEVFEATATGVTFPSDEMVMTSADSGTSLEYRAVPALEGSTWLRAPDAAGDPVTLRLEAGEATGEGPCGAYRADYATDGVFITFTNVRGTGDDTCAATRAERKLLRALRSAVTLDREPARNTSRPRLTLRDARGAALARFEYPFSNAP